MNRAFKANIYCGLRKQYSKKTYSFKFAEKICQQYINEVKWCISITKTKYIYVDGNENGIIVGIIYYPRFPLSNKQLKNRTINLANLLMEQLNQNRVTIVFNNSTKMLINNNFKNL